MTKKAKFKIGQIVIAPISRNDSVIGKIRSVTYIPYQNKYHYSISGKRISDGYMWNITDVEENEIKAANSFETKKEKLIYLYNWCNRGDYQALKESCLRAVRKYDLPLSKAQIAFLPVVEYALSDYKKVTGKPLPKITKSDKMELAKAMAKSQLNR